MGTESDRDMIIRLLRGELGAAEEEAARERIATSASLRSELERLTQLERLLASSSADSFGPYFAERVMRRLRPVARAGRASLHDSLQWVFLRLAAACLIAFIGLGAYNAIEGRTQEASASTVEAIFGLPSTDLESLYYLQGI